MIRQAHRFQLRPFLLDLGALTLIALAPFVVGQLSQLTNLRAALLIVTPPVYLGAYALFKARDHLDADAAKIFEAVLKAMQEQQERDEAKRLAAEGQS